MVARTRQINFTLTGPGRTRPLALARWLFLIAALVVVMVLVGGITRLTESGLSITQWNLVTGIVPPLSESGWQAEFDTYRLTPEYRLEARGMDLAAFKLIYFWEWFHRLLGRLLGLAYALPLAWFWLRGAIPDVIKPRLVVLLALGGAQGVFGWLMVRSGLTGQMTDVSHLWLSVHLMTALATLVLLVWTALDIRTLARADHLPRKLMEHGERESAPGDAAGLLVRPTVLGLVAGAALALQLLLGAWVAGLNAGHAAYDWPLMNGRLFPKIDWSPGIVWTLTHDPFLLHFLHRWWALAALLALVLLARQARRSGGNGAFAGTALNAGVGLQVLLGIATVTAGIVLWLAVLHQLTAALLVAATAWAAHVAGRRA